MRRALRDAPVADAMSRASATRLKPVTLATRPSVLIVESDESCAAAWVHAIRDALGVEVQARGSLTEARSASLHTVVVLGSVGDNTAAITLARELLARPATQRPRVIVVVSAPLRRIERVHLDAVLERPVNTATLIEHVRRLLDLESRQRAALATRTRST